MNLIQQRLGDHVLTEQLRQDSKGRLYRGVHVASETPVTVRVLPAQAGDPELAARFSKEATTLRRLRHPALLEVLEHGTSAHGPYLVMESLAGESLRDRLKREGRLPLAETQRIVGAVASALAAAHRGRLVHRELTADDVWLLGTGADGGVKVLDLGVAKLVGDLVPGTSKGLDQRADILALGSLAYEMLSGQPPLAASADEVTPTSERKRPARLSAQGVTIPSSVDAAIMKALERKKKRRFSSMAEFAQALGVALTPPLPPPAAAPVAPAAASVAPAAVSIAAAAVAPAAEVKPVASTAPALQARIAARATAFAHVAATRLRPLGQLVLARRKLVTAVAGGAAALAVGWFALRSPGKPGAVTPPAQVAARLDVERGHEASVPRPLPAATAPSRVDEILALNGKAVSAYARSDLKTARSLLMDADKLAIASGYQDAMVRAQTQVRLGALFIGGQKNPRLGRRYLAKAVTINPAVRLPADMVSPATTRALHAEKARLAKNRGQKRALKAKPLRRHAREARRKR
jgi:hypothetical protein